MSQTQASSVHANCTKLASWLGSVLTPFVVLVFVSPVPKKQV